MKKKSSPVKNARTQNNECSMLTSVIIFIILALTAVSSIAQEIEPRSYANLPTGANFVALNYNYTTGNIVSDPASPIKDLELNSNNLIAAYVRTFPLFGKLSRVQVLMPFVFLAGTARLAGKDTSATRTGLADTRIRFGINLFGSPALNPKEFATFKDATIFGASLVISIPTGQYFTEKLINIGTNRWGFKPEIGVSTRIGNFYGEAYTGVWFYTKNTEYINTKTLEVEPLFNIQGQINYVFENKMWLGLNAAYANGGDALVDGVSTNSKQDNWRIGGVFSTPLSRQLSAKLQYHTGAVVRRGSDFDFYSISFQYLWF